MDWKKQYLDMLDRALDVAEKVDRKLAKAGVFADIAAIQAKEDPQRAAQAFERALNIAVEAQSSPEEEAEEAKYIDRASAIADITGRILAKVNVQRALEFANEIQNEADKDCVLREIAWELTREDPEQALELFERSHSIDSLVRFVQDLARRTPGKAIQMFDQLLAVAEGIQDSRSRAQTFVRIANGFVEMHPGRAIVLFDQAVAIAEVIGYAGADHKMLHEIAQSLARVDVERAVQVLRKATWADPFLCEEGELGRIADELANVAQVDPGRALDLAEGVLLGYQTVEALWAIAPSLLSLSRVNPKLADQAFQRALTVAEGLQHPLEKVWALSGIAEDLAKLNQRKGVAAFGRALELGEGIEDGNRDNALCYIAMRLAKINPWLALGVAEEILDGVSKTQSFNQIAKQLVNTNSKGAAHAFERALETAEAIPFGGNYVEELGNIVRELANLDPELAGHLFEQAVAAAERIEHLPSRGKVYGLIAQQLAKTDFERAIYMFERAFELTEGIEWQSLREDVIREVAGGLLEASAEANPELALAVATRIRSQGGKVEVIGRIAWNISVGSMPSTDPERALVLSQAIPSGFASEKGMVVEAVIRALPALAKTDLQRALALTERIKDDSHRASALHNIAEALANVDVQRALAVAEEIRDRGHRASALRDIAQALVSVDVQRALAVAEGIQDNGYKGGVLQQIVSELARARLFEKARASADLIPDASNKANALRAIAHELEKIDPQKAAQLYEQTVAVAEGIQEEPRKNWVLGDIAPKLARVSIYKAVKVAETITDPNHQAEAFLGIAETIWEKGSVRLH